MDIQQQLLMYVFCGHNVGAQGFAVSIKFAFSEADARKELPLPNLSLVGVIPAKTVQTIINTAVPAPQPLTLVVEEPKKPPSGKDSFLNSLLLLSDDLVESEKDKTALKRIISNVAKSTASKR